MNNIVFCGPPGSGKGTQCARLAQSCDLFTLSVGDLIRASAKEDTPLGHSISETFSSGRLLPDDVVFNVVKAGIVSVGAEQGILFDGYPRTLEQASDLGTLLESLQRKLTCAIVLEVDSGIIEKRLTGRFVCSGCAATYNEYLKPTHEQGLCDVCSGSAFERRSDDAPSVVRLRLEEYGSRIEQIKSYYAGLGLLRLVDGEGTVSEVTDRVSAILEGEF